MIYLDSASQDLRILALFVKWYGLRVSSNSNNISLWIIKQHHLYGFHAAFKNEG
ncbi:MAG: hypothetical protein QW046_04260 [Candidatus Micrarchaeaceae archaeon]